MGFKYQSADHVFNIINKKLHDNGTIIIQEIEEKLKGKENLDFEARKYVESLQSNVEHFWFMKNNYKRSEQMRVFELRNPLEIITWWAAAKEYVDAEDYLIKIHNLRIKYLRFFEQLDALDDYLMFDLNDVDPEIKHSIFRYPNLTTEDRIYSALKESVTDQFKDAIEFLRGRSGVYFLYNRYDELIYIGKSINLGDRIISSVRERKALKVEYALTNSKSDTSIYESYYIALLKPLLNVDGKYDDALSVELKDIRTRNTISIYERKELYSIG